MEIFATPLPQRFTYTSAKKQVQPEGRLPHLSLDHVHCKTTHCCCNTTSNFSLQGTLVIQLASRGVSLTRGSVVFAKHYGIMMTGESQVALYDRGLIAMEVRTQDSRKQAKEVPGALVFQDVTLCCTTLDCR